MAADKFVLNFSPIYASFGLAYNEGKGYVSPYNSLKSEVFAMIREWLLRVGKQVFLFYCGYGFYEPEQFNKPSAPPNQPESPYTGHPHRRKAG